jgi:hypothetical protein
MLVGQRREEGVRESHPCSVQHDDARSLRLLERREGGFAVLSGGTHQVDRRPGQRRDVEQGLAHRRRELVESLAQQLAQALRDLDAVGAAAGHRPRDLEREVRIAAGDAMDTLELRPCQLQPEPQMQQVLELPDVKRRQRHLDCPELAERIAPGREGRRSTA